MNLLVAGGILAVVVATLLWIYRGRRRPYDRFAIDRNAEGNVYGIRINRND